MEIIILFFLELFLLFILARTLQKKLSLFLYTLTHNMKVTIYLMAIIFFPGTVIHECAHYLVARLLWVRTGKVEFLPVLEGDTVKLGSVQIMKVDPLRRLLIGLAPFLIGTSIILSLLFAVEKHNLWHTSWIIGVIFYALFEIGNTMFSSKKDLEGAIFIISLVFALMTILYLAGLRPTSQNIQSLFSPSILHIFYQGVVYLLFPLGVDCGSLIVLLLSISLLRRR